MKISTYPYIEQFLVFVELKDSSGPKANRKDVEGGSFNPT